jgi:DNA-directed RNA polymerase subunit RPC12/RpoP
MENAEAHLENTNAQFKKVTCPYCGSVNKGSDTKCAGCSAPLNQK